MKIKLGINVEHATFLIIAYLLIKLASKKEDDNNAVPTNNQQALLWLENEE